MKKFIQKVSFPGSFCNNSKLDAIFGSASKITFKENLTVNRKMLYDAAVEAKRDLNYKFLWTTQGRIRLRQDSESPVTFWSPKFLIDVYYSLIYSHLCYCITSWGCASKTRLMPLIKLQKRAVRIISNKKYRDQTNPLFLDCKLLKIAEIYKLELFKLMFKVHKNILTIFDSTTYIPVSTVHHYHIRYRAENFHKKKYFKTIHEKIY